jgi:hypothetical protein
MKNINGFLLIFPQAVNGANVTDIVQKLGFQSRNGSHCRPQESLKAQAFIQGEGEAPKIF